MILTKSVTLRPAFMPFSFSPEQKQNVLWLTVSLLLLILIVMLGPMLTPFVIAAVLAYVLNPGVEWLTGKRVGPATIPRVLAVTIVIVLSIMAILGIILGVIPVLLKEIPLLQEQIPAFLSKVTAWLEPYLRRFGIATKFDNESVKKLLTQQIISNGENLWVSVLASAKTGGAALFTAVANLLFIPMVLFYLLLDWNVFIRRAHVIIPRRWVTKALTLLAEVDDLLAQYLRGQLTVMIILAIYYSTGLAIAGFDIALPVGILTGVFIFIPYVGFGFGLILALIAAVLQFEGLYGLIAVGIIYGIGQVIESFLLTPYLVGERIGLHPLVVIFALLAFGQLFGFFGILLALPASAITSVIVKHVYQNYLTSSFYNRKS
jgi:predicted PurR-regulated permease PerM